MKKIFILMSSLFMLATVVYGQVQITGTVTSSDDGSELPGANITVKGSSTGTISDVDGKYTLSVPEGGTIVYTFIGYASQEIRLSPGQILVEVVLQPSVTAMDEVVVVSYGVKKKANLTGSVASVDFEDLEAIPASNSASLLQGRVAGVSVSNFSTQPGADDPEILIRGMGTFNAGASPLVIVDGVESSLGQVPPGDIKSISVLKDAASASIYGVRAANGVILVTTKTGTAGRTIVNYNTNIGFQQNLIKTELLGSEDFATIRNSWLAADGEDPWYSDTDIQTIRNGSDSDHFADTDWMEEAFRTAMMQTHHLSVSGGNEKTTFMLSSEYFDQDGIMLGTSTNRLNLRSNVNVKISDKLTVGVNVFGYKKRIDEPVEAAAGTDNLGLNYLLRRQTMPTVPAYYSNGDYGFIDGAFDTHSKMSKNIHFDAALGDRYSELSREEGKVYLNYEIIDGLNFNTSFAFINNSIAGSTFKPTYQKNDSEGNPVNENTLNSLLNTNVRNSKYLVENILTYKKSFDKHNFNLLLGQSAQAFREDYFEGYVEDFPNNTIHVLGAGVTNPNVDGYAYESSLASLFGRINYIYEDRYLLEFNIRRDGSSRMPEQNRFGVFPSVSAGWILSNESFLDENELISLLKLRGSWGQLGNQEIGNYAFAQSFNAGHNYVIGGLLVGGAAVSELANPDITWETTTITDIGLDLNLFKGKISIVADWFDKTSTDVLLRLPIPLTMGVDLAPYQNIGEVQNKGWEVAVGFQNKFGEMSLYVNANISQIKNEIKDLGELENWIDGTYHTLNEVGSPIGSFYGLVADGYFTEDDFLHDGSLDTDNNATQYGSLKPGDIKFKDISGPDGIPDGIISEDFDREIIGNPFPDLTYGLTLGAAYKGFDLSMFFQGVKGVDRWQWYNNEADGNYTIAILDYWTPSNTGAAYPSLGNHVNNSKWSSFWIKDASYIRLKNLEFGYTLPSKITSKVHISRARIYFTGYNLLTFTKMVDYDPERLAEDIRAGSYPQTKVYSFGLNLTF